VRIGIVSERPVAAEALQQLIAARTSHRVLWSAGDLAAAAHFASAQKPDLILLSHPFERIDAATVFQQLVRECQCAVLIVSENLRASASFVLQAMGDGALDGVELPTVRDSSDRDASAFVAKLERIGKQLQPGHKRKGRAIHSHRRMHRDLLIGIGASAGGPSAVAMVLQHLPLNVAASVVIVQHVDQEFVPGMASWLTEQTGHAVRVAAEGQTAANGAILLAAGTGHLTLTSTGTIHYSSVPSQHPYTPSVDVFFDSVGRCWKGDVVGVLLTGMGKDGAVGLKTLRDKGHFTIAQDEASSAVYGMPKAAVALDAAVEILPLSLIGPRLVEFAARPIG
jgi:two-component system, chemotaxis family, response regulator WspF